MSDYKLPYTGLNVLEMLRQVDSSSIINFITGDDLQSLIDNAAEYSCIIGDNIELLVDPINITTNGIKLLNFNLKLNNNSDDAVVFIHDCVDVTIAECEINGNSENQNLKSGADRTVNGVYITNAKNIRVFNNYVHDVLEQGIEATSLTDDDDKESGDVQYIYIEGNRLESVDNGYILLTGGGDNEASFGYVRYNYNTTGNGHDFINIIDGFRNAIVENNYMFRCNAAAIVLETHLRDGVRSVENVVIRNNYILKNTEVNIPIIEFSHANNSFSNIEIYGNTFFVKNGAAIEADLDGLDITNLKIHDNQITVIDNTGEFSAILINNITIKGLSIRNNYLIGSNANTQFIQFTNCSYSNVLMKDNYDNEVNSGISIDSVSTSSVEQSGNTSI